MKNKNLLKEVNQFKKIAGLLKEDEQSPGNVEFQGEQYDMADGIGLPYDEGNMAFEFRNIALSLGMQEGHEDDFESDFFFGYERGDTPDTADPSYITILNPEMQSNNAVRKLVMKCIASYD